MRTGLCVCANGAKIACSGDAQWSTKLSSTKLSSTKLSSTKLDVSGKVQLCKTNITRDIAIQP